VVGEVVAEGSVAGVSGGPSDVDALAPGVGRPSVDLSCDRAELSAYDLMCRSGYGLTCRGTAT
jgi:hypothetical protein